MKRTPLKRKSPFTRKRRRNGAWKEDMVVPKAPVHSTTARTPAAALVKDGRFTCRELREFHKAQRCACINWPSGCEGPKDPHHFPTLGAGGDDLGIIPLCRRHHEWAQQYKRGLTAELQQEMAHEALVNFLRNATESERLAFFRAWHDYGEGRVFTEVPF